MTPTSTFRAGTAHAVPYAVPLGLAIALLSRPASGLPPPAAEDDDPRGPRLTLEETTPHELWADGRRAPLWIAIDASMGHGPDGAARFGAMLLLGLPLDRLAGRAPSSRAIAEDTRAPAPPSPALKPPPREAAKLVDPAGPPPAKLAPSPQALPEPPLRVPIGVTPTVARAAVQAALQRQGLLDPDARPLGLASRARTAALLPELRVRVSRTVDEGQTLSPTSYDPTRTTASGGTSLWLEARATWRLDRLVFADEEVALERARVQRAEAQERVIERVLGLLFAWQRALALEDAPSASPEERLASTLKKLEAEAELDIATAGWFTRWRASR